MNWFAVTYIYQVICGEGNHAPQFNEQTRLMYAKDRAHALLKGYEQATQYNESFPNCNKEKVVWKFIDIGCIHEIDIPADGVEIISRIAEPSNVEVYLEKLKHRHNLLSQNS